MAEGWVGQMVVQSAVKMGESTAAMMEMLKVAPTARLMVEQMVHMLAERLAGMKVGLTAAKKDLTSVEKWE